MTPCISPLWTKTGELQKLLANGLHISLVTHGTEMQFLPTDVFKFAVSTSDYY